MNQTLVAKVNNKNIYLVNNETVPFYICIPTEKNVSIVLNLVSKPTEISLNNNMQAITNAITNVYSNFEDNNVAVATPIIDSNLLEQAKLNGNEQIFSYLDKTMSFLINTVYKILTSNNYQVDNVIKLNNNQDYKTFNDWFVNRYNGRVVLAKYNKENNTEKDPTLIMDSFKQPETPAPAPVPNPTPIPAPQEKPDPNTAIANEVLEQTQSLSIGEENEGSSGTKEPGFVSYVLLGVIVAVISLVILYKLL